MDKFRYLSLFRDSAKTFRAGLPEETNTRQTFFRKAIISLPGGVCVQNEDRFPTVRFRKCKACGHVHAGSLTGDDTCPICHASPEKKAPGEQIRKKMNGSHALFTITGTLYKISELEELKAQIEEAIAQEADSIAFAFLASSFLNSSTINLLVKTMHSLSVHGKPTFIITDDPEVLESLQMMDLDRVMCLCPSLEQYKASLG